MEDASSFLSGSYVRQNGRIFQFGCIRIFSNEVVDTPDSERGGLACWSEKFFPFGDGKFYAVIDHKSSTVSVYGKNKSSIKVASVPFSQIFSVDVYTVLVEEDGWLATTGSIDGKFQEIVSSPIETLKKASKGECPDVNELDNSEFEQVSVNLVSTELVRIEFRYDEEESCRIYTLDGQPVECTVSTPLAFERWGVDPPSHFDFGIGG